MTTQAHTPRQESGFTLVEVLVSITILSIASLGIGRLMFRAARVAAAANDATYQTAALTSEASRLGALPYDALVVGATCASVAEPHFPHDLCSDITQLSPKVRRVKVVVTPTASSQLPPDSTSFNRTISGNGNPLKTQ